MHLSNNTLLQGGKYKIVRFISSGGFGCTYEAEHIMLHKRVAIKEFFVKDFCNRDETTSQISVGITSKTALVDKLKKKFVEEAQSLCALEHPNIVHVFDVFEDNGTAYYVMDYIDGPSLNDLVKKNGPMSESKALGYIKQVADALKYVHSRNRLHLDIKPGNIMVDEKDRAILIDFGASKQYDEEAGENTSTLLGKTPGYAPLEQMGNDVVKFLPSTDIYALGATLYKLLTGATPPSASLLASGETLEEMPSSISAGTRNAIFQSMQTNKMKRPQSIKEWMNLLGKSSSPAAIGTVKDTPAPKLEFDDESTRIETGAWQKEDTVCQATGVGGEFPIITKIILWLTILINAYSILYYSVDLINTSISYDPFFITSFYISQIVFLIGQVMLLRKNKMGFWPLFLGNALFSFQGMVILTDYYGESISQTDIWCDVVIPIICILILAFSIFDIIRGNRKRANILLAINPIIWILSGMFSGRDYYIWYYAFFAYFPAIFIYLVLLIKKEEISSLDMICKN